MKSKYRNAYFKYLHNPECTAMQHCCSYKKCMQGRLPDLILFYSFSDPGLLIVPDFGRSRPLSQQRKQRPWKRQRKLPGRQQRRQRPNCSSWENSRRGRRGRWGRKWKRWRRKGAMGSQMSPPLRFELTPILFFIFLMWQCLRLCLFHGIYTLCTFILPPDCTQRLRWGWLRDEIRILVKVMEMLFVGGGIFECESSILSASLVGSMGM